MWDSTEVVAFYHEVTKAMETTKKKSPVQTNSFVPFVFFVSS
jgi:hypothetical protein